MFKIGDEVIIVNGTPYEITKKGSEGTITAIHRDSIDIRFYKITSNYQEYLGNSFQIDVNDLALLSPKTNTEVVIDKIREMNNRFNTRKQDESVFF